MGLLGLKLIVNCKGPEIPKRSYAQKARLLLRPFTAEEAEEDARLVLVYALKSKLSWTSDHVNTRSELIWPQR